MPIVAACCSKLLYCKCVFLMLHAVSLLASFSASSLPVSPPLSCLDGSSAEAHLSRCSSCRKKKNQFHRRCKDVITLHAEYKPVSSLTIWFQLNYLYTPYFQGWGDRFEAYLLMRCSFRWLGLVINYAIFFVLLEIRLSEHWHVLKRVGREGSAKHGWVHSRLQ